MPRFVAASFAVVLSALSPLKAEAATTFRVATLAPKASSWGKIFVSWQKAIEQKTHGELQLDVYYNGVHGMEDSMVAKMKAGQLDGAVVSSIGLSDVFKPVLALQLPGVLTDWKTLDRVRNALSPELTKGFEEAGFTLLSWADVGLVRPFSNGFALHKPEDMKGKRPMVYQQDPILPMMFSAIGGVVPSPLSIGEVLPALRTGSTNVVMAPGLAVEQLQWAPFLDHVSEFVMVGAIGGTVFRKESIEGLPADIRSAFLEVQKRVGEVQTTRVRADDEACYERVAKKVERTQLTDAERAAWTQIMKESVRRLAAQSTFPRPLIEKVVSLAAQGG